MPIFDSWTDSAGIYVSSYEKSFPEGVRTLFPLVLEEIKKLPCDILAKDNCDMLNKLINKNEEIKRIVEAAYSKDSSRGSGHGHAFSQAQNDLPEYIVRFLKEKEDLPTLDDALRNLSPEPHYGTI